MTINKSTINQNDINTIIQNNNDIDSLSNIIYTLTSNDLLYFMNDNDIKQCIDTLYYARCNQIDDYIDNVNDM